MIDNPPIIENQILYIQTIEPMSTPSACWQIVEDKLPIDHDILLVTPYNSSPFKALKRWLQVKIYKRCVGVEKGA